MVNGPDLADLHQLAVVWEARRIYPYSELRTALAKDARVAAEKASAAQILSTAQDLAGDLVRRSS